MVIDTTTKRWLWRGPAGSGTCQNKIDTENVIKPAIIASVKNMAEKTYNNVRFLDSVEKLSSIKLGPDEVIAIVSLSLVGVTMDLKPSLWAGTYIKQGKMSFKAELRNDQGEKLEFNSLGIFSQESDAPAFAGPNRCTKFGADMTAIMQSTLKEGIDSLQRQLIVQHNRL